MTNDKGNVIPWLVAAVAVFYAVSQSVPAPHAPVSAATIINDPQPTPAKAEFSPPPPAEPKESTVAHDAPAVEAETKPRPSVVPPTEDADATPPTPAVVEWQPDPIWFDDYDAAMQNATVTGRRVVVIFSPDYFNCRPCKKLVDDLTPFLTGKGQVGWVGVIREVSKDWAAQNDLDFPGYALAEPDHNPKGGNALPAVLASGDKQDAAFILRLLKEIQ